MTNQSLSITPKQILELPSSLVACFWRKPTPHRENIYTPLRKGSGWEGMFSLTGDGSNRSTRRKRHRKIDPVTLLLWGDGCNYCTLHSHAAHWTEQYTHVHYKEEEPRTQIYTEIFLDFFLLEQRRLREKSGTDKWGTHGKEQVCWLQTKR